jgi:hypothetical protein
LLDAKSKKDVETKIEKLLATERDFAENSPMPPPEFAATGVYCTGDDCHKIRPKWERPLADVTPPKSSVKPVWTVEGFGSGKSSAGNAAIHFGDTKPSLETETPGTPATTKSNGAKPAAKSHGAKAVAKSGGKKPAKSAAVATAARKGRG